MSFQVWGVMSSLGLQDMSEVEMSTNRVAKVRATDDLRGAIERYGFVGTMRLFRDLVLSKLICVKVRLIRHPYYFRGIRAIDFGVGFTSGVGLRIDAFGNGPHQVQFGSNVQVGDYVHIGAVESVRIGNNVLMASKVYISDHDHGTYSGDGFPVSLPTELQSEKLLLVAPVCIGNNVWLGEGVCVLKGVSIGDNSIIGAASVVNKSIPPNSIAVGIPAKVVKHFDFELNMWVPVRG